MSICKLLLYDVRQGSLRYKRYIYLLVVSILQCMLVQMQLDDKVSYAELFGIENCEYHFKDVVITFFGGCDPFLKVEMGSFPYAWFAVYLCVLFTTFDYMHLDLTQFGTQVLSRSKSRVKWWGAKCLWNIITIVISYLLIILVCVAFCLIVGIPLTFEDNYGMDKLLSFQTSCYTPKETFSFGLKDMTILILCPLITMLSLSLLQMALSLIFKPIFSFAIMIGFFIFSIITDLKIAFPRTGMLLYSLSFYKNGYSSITGIIICVFIGILSVLTGAFIFRHFDILPDKEVK